MNREHYINPVQFGARFFHDSRLALLILPLFVPGQPDPTLDYARQFTDAFNIVFLLEGKQALNFLNTLKPAERNIIIHILNQGGMTGATYQAGDDIFSIRENNDRVRQ